MKETITKTELIKHGLNRIEEISFNAEDSRQMLKIYGKKLNLLLLLVAVDLLVSLVCFVSMMKN